MRWPHLSSRLRSRIVRRTGRARTPRPRWRFVRPCLEVLEDRLAPATFTVSNLNDSGDGSLRQAIDDADITLGAHTIDFQAGLTGTINLTRGPLFLINNMIIQGPAGGLTLNAEGRSGIFVVSGSGNDNAFSVELSGLTLIGGNAFVGGAIQNNANLLLTNCTLEGNSAEAGGSIFNNSGSELVLANCTLAGNSAAGLEGGGIWNNGGSVAIENCTLAHNSAVFAGGGISNVGTAALAHCTLADNSAAAGGGIANVAIATLDNTIVFGSTSGDDVVNIGALTGSNNLIGLGVGTDSLSNPIEGNPQLETLQPNGGPTETIAIPTSSAAFQAGLGLLSRLVTTDQRGLPRPPTPSLGAFEPQLSPLPPSPAPPRSPAPPLAQTSPTLFQAVHTLFINGAQLVLDARGFGPLFNLPAQSDILASIHSNLPFAGIFGLPAVRAGADAANDALSGSSS